MPEPDKIKVMCPNLTCRRVLAVPGAARGKVVRCRHCSTTIKIPPPTPTQSSTPKPDAAA